MVNLILCIQFLLVQHDKLVHNSLSSNKEGSCYTTKEYFRVLLDDLRLCFWNSHSQERERGTQIFGIFRF